ncbi:MAG: peptidase M75 [Muribaculaceae bacterium]|nr:peptidase M75 [Muribaculaceae bacterium]
MKRTLLFSVTALALMSLAACTDDKSKDLDNENPSTGNGPSQSYGPAESTVCLSQMIEGSADIANEVGTSKIGEPYDLWIEGNKTGAVYAVESWYSWHSRDDYSNNILSIANTYAGTTTSTANINNGGIEWSVSNNSLAHFVESNNPTLDAEVRKAINDAWIAIQNIPQPFRNNIDSDETIDAMEACSDLEVLLTNNLQTYVMGLTSNYDNELNAIVANYVDNVVLPTYSELVSGNSKLLDAVNTLAQALMNNPESADFAPACEAWLSARAPWEKSEAFLFGPVDALGLDPNMDSWPLDQDEIVKILNSGNFDDLDWSDSDADDEIEAAQNVRGYHTLEFLLFKNGEARKYVADSEATTPEDMDVNSINYKSWANYMIQVATLLVKDAEDLYDSWTKSYEGGRPYADIFKSFDI